MDIQSMYEETGEHCPFMLARMKGIKLEHEYFELDVCGVYLYNEDLGNYYIILNTKMDRELQEAACQLLMEHHIMHPNIDRSLNIDQIKQLNRADRAARKYLKVVTEAFLNLKKYAPQS